MNTENVTILAERLRIIRKSNSLTQEEFAKRLGIKVRAYRNYEIALRDVPITVVQDVCAKFPDVDIQWLILGIKKDIGHEVAGIAEAAALAAHEHFAAQGINPTPEQASVIIRYIAGEVVREKDSGAEDKKKRVADYLRSVILPTKKSAN